LFALVTIVSTLTASFMPAPGRLALAKNADALGDTLILAGPGGDYGILTVAPAGSSLAIQGDAVDGYVPVNFNGVDGWAPQGLLSTNGGGGDNGDNGNGDNGNGGGGNGGNGGGDDGGGDGGKHGNSSSGNGGVETVSADPIYSDGGAPAAAAPSDTGDSVASDTGDGAASDPMAAPVSGGEYGPGGSSYSQDQIVGIINEAADNYGQSRDDMLRVARCESGLDPHAVGGGGAYHGLYQFVPSTFEGTPYGQYDIYDPWANANAASWMWAEGHKNEWVCQ
jgi:hypothetical protein